MNSSRWPSFCSEAYRLAMESTLTLKPSAPFVGLSRRRMRLAARSIRHTPLSSPLPTGRPLRSNELAPARCGKEQVRPYGYSHARDRDVRGTAGSDAVVKPDEADRRERE